MPIREAEMKTITRKAGRQDRNGEKMIGTRANGASKGGAVAVGFLVAALAAVCLLLAAKPALAATLIVNSTGDSGDNNPGNGTCATAPFPVGTEPECTLRAAIEESNATTAPDTIHFNIGGSGVKTISPTSVLPIVAEPVTINGYSEPGATENALAAGDNAVLRIRLDGVNALGLSRGLFITADDSVVRGLSITRFAGAGIDIAVGDNSTIEGNFVGITPSGEDAGNGGGVSIRNGASGNTVGGATPRARNIISGNGPGQVGDTGVGILEIGTTNNRVMGNYIGTTKSGTGDLGNTGRGLFVGNGASGNVIGDNDPTDGLANAANIIAFNGLVGVEVSSASSTGNSILSNSIHSNARLGIDLGFDGVTPNDGPGDADTGPNNLQNFPVITSAKTGRKGTAIRGTLEGIPSQGIAQGYTIQFFKNPKSTKDEGKKFIGQKIAVDGNGDGIIPFAFKPPKKVKEGLFVTATATYGPDTSEFSVAKKVR